MLTVTVNKFFSSSPYLPKIVIVFFALIILHISSEAQAQDKYRIQSFANLSTRDVNYVDRRIESLDERQQEVFFNIVKAQYFAPRCGVSTNDDLIKRHKNLYNLKQHLSDRRILKFVISAFHLELGGEGDFYKLGLQQICLALLLEAGFSAFSTDGSYFIIPANRENIKPKILPPLDYDFPLPLWSKLLIILALCVPIYFVLATTIWFLYSVFINPFFVTNNFFLNLSIVFIRIILLAVFIYVPWFFSETVLPSFFDWSPLGSGKLVLVVASYSVCGILCLSGSGIYQRVLLRKHLKHRDYTSHVATIGLITLALTTGAGLMVWYFWDRIISSF